MTGRRILVTGGCGFIGANLIPHLVQRGCAIRMLDDLSRGRREFLADQPVEFRLGDIRDPAIVREAARGVHAIIHLAAYGSVVESIADPLANFEVNGRGTLNVLAAAAEAGVEKFVFALTGGALIGDAEPPVDEESVPRPISPYGASKLVGEAYCHAFAHSFGLRTVMLRFANIYGPVSAHKRGAITVFCKALIADEPITIYGDGSATRDLLHVTDLCDGIVGALAADLAPATVLHLATGRETSVRDVAEILRTAAGKPHHPIRHAAPRPGEVHRNFATYDRARELIRFAPRTTVEEGLRQTWAWFEAQGTEVLEVEASDA